MSDIFNLPPYIITGLEFSATLFIFVIGSILAIIVVLFFVDITQTKDAVRRNFPVIGRFRYLFQELGEFFRQYFFAMDREEMPFNRAEREWVYRSSKNNDNTSAFGSTKNLKAIGSHIFVNCAFPTLEEDSCKSQSVSFGPYTKYPYEAPSFFNISGMSYGALSTPAVRALSRGAKLANCWLNTGEGGLSPHHLEGGCDIIFQIGTAKYGVRDQEGNLHEESLKEIAAHEQVRMIEVKLSQGAKPGKGGILPGSKVTKEIAEIRGIPEGEDSISPNRHPEINSVDELLDFIARVRSLTNKPTGIKTVIGSYGWLETMCQAIHQRGIESAPDFITLDSGDGGTGAAPMSLMDNVGLTIDESLPLTVDILNQYGLKDRIKIIASGKLITPEQVAWALCAGADCINSARGFMFSLGCIQALKCNKNTCPTGVTTHNKRLQKGLDPMNKSVRVAHYCENLRHEVEVIAHSCGVQHPHQLKRYHVRIMQSNGRSIPLNDLYPDVETKVSQSA